MLPDDKTKNRAVVATAFAGVSAASVTAVSLYSDNFQNLMILPGFALAAAADYMGDNKSHTARFLRFGAFSTVLTYDAAIPGNLGGGLSSVLLLYQTYKTAKMSGDFENNIGGKVSNIQKISSYLASLNIPK